MHTAAASCVQRRARGMIERSRVRELRLSLDSLWRTENVIRNLVKTSSGTSWFEVRFGFLACVCIYIYKYIHTHVCVCFCERVRVGQGTKATIQTLT